MSAVTHKVLSLAEEDLRSAKYRPRSWGLDGRKSLVYQVFIGQSDTTSYGPRSTVNCTIGCPGLQKVPFFKWQKMGLRAPKSKNGRQKPHKTPLKMVDIWFMRFHFKAGNQANFEKSHIINHFGAIFPLHRPKTKQVVHLVKYRDMGLKIGTRLHDMVIQDVQKIGPRF